MITLDTYQNEQSKTNIGKTKCWYECGATGTFIRCEWEFTNAEKVYNII